MSGRLRVYCGTTFWSWLVARPATNPDHAVKQAYTRKWWEECAPLCDIYVSNHVVKESLNGDAMQSSLRMSEIGKYEMLDGDSPLVYSLAKNLLNAHAVPQNEIADAFHIATSAVFGMDILLTTTAATWRTWSLCRRQRPSLLWPATSVRRY